MDDRRGWGRISRRDFAFGGAGLAACSALRPARGLASAAVVEIVPSPVSDLASYDVSIPAACKAGDFYRYSCEFDAAWAVLKTYGIETTMEEQLSTIAIDRRIEPYYEETDAGVVTYGGDITTAYSGDYTANFLARTTGAAMRHVFKHFGMCCTRSGD
jgi:hypothetical protein